MGRKRIQKRQGEENKRVGRIAQKKFDFWCTQANLTVNSSVEDDEGWDFFVQAKSSNEPVPLLDKRPPPFSALVQVKGTAASDGKYRMTLSNALKLAQAPGPMFVFVAHVQGDDVRRAWLVHCGARFITKTLEAATRHDQAKDLNEVSLSFSPNQDEEVEPASLGSRLKETIGDARKYFEWKREIVERAGYDKAPILVTVRQSGQTLERYHDALADFVLGLRDLQVDSVEVFDVRFGQKRLMNTITRPTLSRPMAPSDPNAKLIVEGADERVVVECAGYLASAYIPFLPKEANRLRLVAPFLEFRITRTPDRPDIMMLQWSAPGMDSPVSSKNLDDKVKAAAVLRLIQRPGAKASIDLGNGRLNVPLHGEWDEKSQEANAYLEALENLRTVCTSYGIPIENEIEPDELVRVRTQLQILASIAGGKGADANMRFPKADPPGGVAIHDRVAIVFGVVLGLGLTKVAVATVLRGTVEDADEGHFRLRSDTLPRLGHLVFERTTNKQIRDLLNRAAKTLEEGGTEKVFIRPLKGLPRAWNEANSPKRLAGTTSGRPSRS